MFRSTITGMRDPLAHDPTTILTEAGVDTSRLEQRWRPYLSIDPPIAIQRARALLRPPGSVELVMEGDTLRIGGNVTADWAGNLLTSPLPPGIGSLNWSELVVEPPSGLQSQRDEIEAMRVLFPTGSSQLTPSGSETLGRAADLLNNLARSAEPMGLSVEVELVGRADASGPNQRNAVLSQERAEAVRAALTDDLTTAVRVRAGGIGTDRPLADVAGVAAAPLNRSVSLLLHFTFGRNPGGAAR